MQTENGAKGRDSAADTLLEELWETYADQLTRYVRRRASDLDATEIVSRVFENTYRAMLAGRGPDDNARAYLYAATRREIAHEQQRQSRLTSLELFEPSEIIAGTTIAANYPSDTVLLKEVLNEFNTSDRRLLEEVLGEGRSLGAVARELGMDPSVASRRLYKIRPRLKANWIQRHLRIASAPETCHIFLRQAGAVLAGTASASTVSQFWDHVGSCPWCPPLIVEAEESSRKLGFVAPLALLPYLPFSPVPFDHPKVIGDPGPSRISRRVIDTVLWRAGAFTIAVLVVILALPWQSSESGPAAVTPSQGSSFSAAATPANAPAPMSPTTLTHPLQRPPRQKLNSLPSNRPDLQPCSWSLVALCNRY